LRFELRHFTVVLLLLVSLVGFLGINSPASAGLRVASVTTPIPITTTTYVNTVTSMIPTTSTTVSTSFSTSVTTTSTSTTSLTTFFSYTGTVSTSVTTTSISTSITGTVTSTGPIITTAPTTTTQTSTSTSTVKIPTICPVGLVVAGSALEPIANALRGFRNSQVMGTTAGRAFMAAFNAWYYSWAPSVSYAAAANPWFFQALRLSVYPLIGILYASYLSYQVVSPLSAEAGAIAAGMVAASLIGLVYVAPVAYLSLRLIRRRVRFPTLARLRFLPSAVWMAASALMIGVAYVSGSAWLMGLGTASLTLSMLSAGSILGTKAWTYVQLPFTGLQAVSFVARRMSRLLH
jgi:hypothetical protein